MEIMSSTYANKPQEAKIVQKGLKNVRRTRVKLYRASSNSPLEVSDEAKKQFTRLKRKTKAPDYAYIRIECEETGVSGALELGVYFDDCLHRNDVVYLSNKILFILDKDTIKLVTGRTLYYDDSFYLASPDGLPVYLSLADVPEA